MRARTVLVCALAAALMLATSTLASAQAAKFSNVRDAVPKKYFESNTTKPSLTQPNRLIIGFDSGIDSTTLTTNEFVASPLSFNNRYVADSISFVVKAPAGYYISRITYTQRGTASTTRTAVQAGTTEWVVAGRPAHIGTYTSSPNLTGRADLSGLKLTIVPVSISVSLFATTGSMKLTAADVLVELVPKF